MKPRVKQLDLFTFVAENKQKIGNTYKEENRQENRTWHIKAEAEHYIRNFSSSSHSFANVKYGLFDLALFLSKEMMINLCI